MHTLKAATVAGAARVAAQRRVEARGAAANFTLPQKPAADAGLATARRPSKAGAGETRALARVARARTLRVAKAGAETAKTVVACA